MKRHPVVERLWDEVDQTVEALGFALVQMTYGGPLGDPSLTVYADRAEGVTADHGVSADDCALLAEHLSVLLDGLDPIPGAYNLIVSSPGLDRPLGQDADFARYAGERATIRYRGESGQARRVRGTLAGVEDGRVLLDTDGGRQALPLDQISAANLVYDWEGEGE
jgi:ribosome maturation factor RimP